MNNSKDQIIRAVESKKDEIIDTWYTECTHPDNFSRDSIRLWCGDMFRIISLHLENDSRQELKKLAKEMGTMFADQQINLSDIFMNFKIFRRVFWTKLKEDIDLPRNKKQNTYFDFGIIINQTLDDLYYWCTVYYDKRLKIKFKNNKLTIKNLREQKEQKEKTIKKMHEQKLEVIGQLAAGMAHELKNPLTSIKGFLQLINKEHPHPERVQSYFDIISKEFDRLQVLLNHFLTLAKRRNTDEPEKKIISLNHVLDKMIEFIQYEVVYRSIDFTTDIEEELPCIQANEAELEQVLLNLLKNAFEAVQDDKDKRVTLSAKKDGNKQVMISIFNTGDTIPPEILNQVFEPFITSKSTGTGLGLAICKHIIDSHHGDIVIYSEEQQGTSITIKLPVAGSI